MWLWLTRTNLPVAFSLISALESTFGSVDIALRMYPVTLSSTSGETVNRAVNPMEEVAWSMSFNSTGGEGSSWRQKKQQVHVKQHSPRSQYIAKTVSTNHEQFIS